MQVRPEATKSDTISSSVALGFSADDAATLLANEAEAKDAIASGLGDFLDISPSYIEVTESARTHAYYAQYAVTN